MAKINVKSVKPVDPKCYAYTLPSIPDLDGWTKIGYTEREVETRVKEQTHTAGVEPKIHWGLPARFDTKPRDSFTDRAFHRYLERLGIERQTGHEWFAIEPAQAKKYFYDFREDHGVIHADESNSSVLPYTLRFEQNQAVDKTVHYFDTHPHGEFLWNAKPRFGKTLATYDLCKRIDAKKILIVTNRPAIANSWYSDYETFLGQQSGYLFISEIESLKKHPFVFSREEYRQFIRQNNDDEKYTGFIEFVSLQDLKGSVDFGGQYEKLKEISEYKWDILVIDEAHEGVDTYKTDLAFDNIDRKCTLHLSGTPFKALANDKFADEAIFNWTYADEQKAKREWDDSQEIENPYANLPKLNLFTYQMSEIVRDKISQGIQLADNEIEEYAFDLNEFFATNDSEKFIHDKEVNAFLDALARQEKFPFSTPELRDELRHTFWLLNRVSSAKALAKKLEVHSIFHDYKIILAAGDGRQSEDDEKIREDAFNRVTKAIHENDKTITLSVGQLTTGVTIPEWTGVLMLSNMSSPSLYMQAAFRAQTPCLFQVGEESMRKENSYVFDFDPARTLTIFEKYANDLIPSSSSERGDDDRKRRVRELLNFFPVYGEGNEGEMIKLDAESVLSIPRRIHAREVVDRGFMSNFLFSNISAVFNASSDILEAISSLQAQEEPKKLSHVDIDESTSDRLHLNEQNEVEISDEVSIGLEKELFGQGIYSEISDSLAESIHDGIIASHGEKSSDFELMRKLENVFATPMANQLIDTAKKNMPKGLSSSSQKKMEHTVREKTSKVVKQHYGKYRIAATKLDNEKKAKIENAQSSAASMDTITRIEEEYEQKVGNLYQEMLERVQGDLTDKDFIDDVGTSIARTATTDELNNERDDKMKLVRDHLRGFTRTIPAFLMAYGTEKTTLENFDTIVDAQTFREVASITLEQFRQLRDGYDYYEKDSNGNEIRDDAHKKHFEGHLFDEVVFNDAIQEFLKKRHDLANYFDEGQEGDIFDYIPPQKTNQIFTPKKVVIDMVNRLEEENPGCFDDPDKTFADLYMKSGMYIAQIVTRLYRSERMKALYPDDKERINHIFSQQVFGCAPTQIIYDICRRYLLGFSDEIVIEKDNIKLCDSLEYAKSGNLEEKLQEIFEL